MQDGANPPQMVGGAQIPAPKPKGLQDPVVLIVVIMVVAIVIIGSVAAYILFSNLIDEIDDLDSLDFTERIEHDFPAESYTALDVSNVNGYVKIVGHEGADTIEIEGLKKAHTLEDLDDIELQITEEEGTLVLAVVREFDFSLGEAMDLEIIIPSDIILSNAESVNGDVEVTGVESVVRARSTNGEVDVEILTAGNDISISTTNGDIHMHLLTTLNATLDMTTTNGDISMNDVELDLSVNLPNHVSGDLGSGGYDIDIATLNGSIDLHVLD